MHAPRPFLVLLVYMYMYVGKKRPRITAKSHHPPHNTIKQVLGRFLRRRHRVQRQRALLQATQAVCGPARLKWEGESMALEERFKQEVALLRG